MKKIFAIILLTVILLTGCTARVADNGVSKAAATEKSEKMNNALYVRSVWIAYYELQEFIDNNSEKKFRKTVTAKFKQLKDMGFNTVTVQVRPCGDAFYVSDYFPSSRYCFGREGVYMPYDPLKVMCEVCEKINMRIEAWVNPYRVSQKGDIDALCDTNIAKKWYHSKNKKSNVYVTKSSIHFNPASVEVTKLIVNGVREIAEKYNVDAIHFDDYFYPTTSKKIDSKEYAAYKEKGGKMNLSSWRRNNVSNMIKCVYAAIKKANKDILFGVSPSANISNNYATLYADVEKWCTQEGYLDYICPQIYYGFYNDVMPFMYTAKKWSRLSEKTLYAGLPLYKSGEKDKYASVDNKRGINEFINNNDIISRQIVFISKLDSFSGFYVFSYSSLFDEGCRKEAKNMLEAMKN